MAIIFAYIKNRKAKVKAAGKTLSLLTLLVAISKYLSEIISKEKGIRLDMAENIVFDCIKDGMKNNRNVVHECWRSESITMTIF